MEKVMKSFLLDLLQCKNTVSLKRKESPLKYYVTSFHKKSIKTLETTFFLVLVCATNSYFLIYPPRSCLGLIYKIIKILPRFVTL